MPTNNRIGGNYMSQQSHNEQQPQNQPDEVVDGIAYITGEYLSAACNMVAQQFIEDEEEYGKGEEERIRFVNKCADQLRQHTPLAYSYFFQYGITDEALPRGTSDIILGYIREKKPTFLGGDAHGRIFIP